jgi:tungstate transport system substrate-binding protein
MNTRRTLLRLGAGVAAVAVPAWARALQNRSVGDPLRLAADDALVDSGLAPMIQRSFAHDTGVAIQVLRGPATTVLQALERGEHDAALSNAPALELPLEKQGLVHDRRRIAISDFVIVGPSALAKPLAAGHDVALALQRLAKAEVAFVSLPDGSGTHLAEQAAWRAAQVAPAGAWYRTAPSGGGLLAKAREQSACTLVDRGVWAAQPVKGYAVLAEGDSRLAVDIHVMRSFRAEHPAGKLFVKWIASDKGRALAASQRGYRLAGG